MAKRAPDRPKADPKTHKIGPKKRLRCMQNRVPLEGPKGPQTRQGERGSPPSNFGPQKRIKATENPLDFSGKEAKPWPMQML